MKLLEEGSFDDFMDYLEYIESNLLGSRSEDNYCFRCGKELKPLTYLEPDFYRVPCWNCMSTNNSDRKYMVESIQSNIKDFYRIILGDRYYQLFIVDDIYLRTTFPHSYTVFKKVVNSLETPSRTDTWFLDWNPGYPKIINLENLPGIKIVNLTKYHTVRQESTRIKVDDFEILMPEEIEPDSTHKARYSIFAGRNGRSRRIEIDGKCYKLYDTDNMYTKSLFRLKKFGEDYPVASLNHQEFVILKLAFMRNKTFLKFLFSIIGELLKNTGVYRDSVFLKNAVIINPDNKNKVNLVWTVQSPHYKDDNDFINLSLL